MRISKQSAGELRIGIKVIPEDRVEHACFGLRRFNVKHGVTKVSDGWVEIEVPIEEAKTARELLHLDDIFQLLDFTCTLLSDAEGTLTMAMEAAMLPSPSHEILTDLAGEIGEVRERIRRELDNPTVDHKDGRLSDWMDLEN